jgi:ABC-type sugar transport system substrate-binding protein
MRITPTVCLALASLALAACDAPASKKPGSDEGPAAPAGAAAKASGAPDPAGRADDIQTMRESYKQKIAGKTVVFLPIAMGFDLTEGWAAIMKQQARELGFKLVIKDPNWSTDAQLEAMTAIIADKPDLIVVHNSNLQLLAKSLAKAEKEGIRVIQLNMPSAHQTEAYVGADWIDLGQKTGDTMIDECSTKKGKSGKVAVIQGQITDAASVYQLQGFNAALKARPGEIQVVSTQAAEWDATKAKAVAESVVQQYKDLCGVFGMWDGMMKGAGEVIKAASASRAEPIKVYTSGGGAMLDCNGISDGIFTHVWAYNVPDQARDITDVMKIVLQTDGKPGAFHFSLFTPLIDLNKSTIGPGVCWDLQELKARTGTK